MVFFVALVKWKFSYMSSSKFVSHTLGDYKETDQIHMKQESTAYFFFYFTITDFANLFSLTNCCQTWMFIFL